MPLYLQDFQVLDVYVMHGIIYSVYEMTSMSIDVVLSVAEVWEEKNICRGERKKKELFAPGTLAIMLTLWLVFFFFPSSVRTLRFRIHCMVSTEEEGSSGKIADCHR